MFPTAIASRFASPDCGFRHRAAPARGAVRCRTERRRRRGRSTSNPTRRGPEQAPAGAGRGARTRRAEAASGGTEGRAGSRGSGCASGRRCSRHRTGAVSASADDALVGAAEVRMKEGVNEFVDGDDRDQSSQQDERHKEQRVAAQGQRDIPQEMPPAAADGQGGRDAGGIREQLHDDRSGFAQRRPRSVGREVGFRNGSHMKSHGAVVADARGGARAKRCARASALARHGLRAAPQTRRESQLLVGFFPRAVA